MDETTIGKTTMGETAAAATHAAKCELAAEVLRSSGHLRLKVTGWSMLPAIWPGDTLMIQRAQRDAVSEGDIVLCARDRRFSAHRVVDKSAVDSRVVTRGDAMAQSDPPVAQHDLLGKVAFIVRDGKCIEPGRKQNFPKRAVAALVRHSDLAARVVVRVHGLRQRQEAENSNDQAFPCQGKTCQS